MVTTVSLVTVAGDTQPVIYWTRQTWERQMSTYKPDYQRIADDLREQITDGRLSPGDKLPSKRELRDIYGTSAQPVEAALFLLRAEGLIEGRQGKGTFVLERE